MNGFIPQTSGNVAAFYNQPGQPSGVNIGDLWYDNINSQFKEWNGNTWQVIYLPPGMTQKNAIINGNMDVWQRATAQTATAFNTCNTADRYKNFMVLGSGGAVTMGQSTDVPTIAQSGTFSSYSLNCQVSVAQSSIASGDYFIVAQLIEGFNFRPLAQRYFTISFWVKAFKPGIYGITLRATNNIYSYIVEYSINSSATWEKKVIVISPSPASGAWNYTNGTGLSIYWTMAMGSAFWATTTNQWLAGSLASTSNHVNGLDSTSNYFRLSQIQVEPGIVATPFEERIFADELLRCQRYCWAVGWDSSVGANWVIATGRETSAGGGAVLIQLPTTMRTTPTNTPAVTASNFQGDDGIAFGVIGTLSYALSNSGLDRVWFNTAHAYAAGTGNSCIIYTTNNSSRLILDAEL